MSKPTFQFNYDFSTFLGDISEEVQSALEQTGNDIIDVTKQLAPVDTGDLRDSYTWYPLGEGEIIIGSDPFRGVYRRGHPTTYAPYVEFGTSRSPAQPHFVPAMEQVSDTLVTRLGQFLRRRSR